MKHKRKKDYVALQKKNYCYVYHQNNNNLTFTKFELNKYQIIMMHFDKIICPIVMYVNSINT